MRLLIVMRYLLQVLAFYFESGAAAVAQGGMMNGEDVQLDEKTEAARAVAAQPASPLISTAAVASATPSFLSSSLSLLTESPQSSISVLQPPHAPKHSPLTMALPAPPTPPQVILTPPAISQTPAQIRTHDKEVQPYEEPHVTWSVADAEQDTAAAEASAGQDGEGWESGHGR